MKCCKGCTPPRRTPYCHAECRQYIEERAKHDKLKAAADKERAIHNGCYTQKVQSIKRAVRRSGRRRK